MGSPSWSLPQNATREQDAPSSVQASSSGGGGGGGRRISLGIYNLLDLRQGDLGGTLPLLAYPVAGRISHFLEAWRGITNDQWVIQIASQGYTLPFVAAPPISNRPMEIPLPITLPKHEVLWKEVWSLLDQGAIEELLPGAGGFYSHYFLASKTSGFQPIRNLRWLNA